MEREHGDDRNRAQHIAADEALTQAVVESGVAAIAYETVETDDRRLPLLAGGRAHGVGLPHRAHAARAVVRRDTGLRTARRISHCFIMDVPAHAEALVITDSILATDAVKNAHNIRVLSIAPLLGEAIRRINEERSVSSLFD